MALAELVAREAAWVVPLDTALSGVHRGPDGIASLRSRIDELTAGMWRPLKADSFDIIRDRPKSVDLDEFLARPLFTHLATASEEGPRESHVWFLWENEAIWIIGSWRDDTFPARLAREPRCALGIVDFDRERGVVHHVGMRGHATVEKFDRQRARRLLAR